MDLLRLSAWAPSFSRADGIKYGESGAAKGRKLGIAEWPSEARRSSEGLPKAGRTIGDCSVVDRSLGGPLFFCV